MGDVKMIEQAITAALRRRGWTVERSASGTVYLTVPGRQGDPQARLRLADHYVPETDERRHNRHHGRRGWAVEVVVDGHEACLSVARKVVGAVRDIDHRPARERRRRPTPRRLSLHKLALRRGGWEEWERLVPVINAAIDRGRREQVEAAYRRGDLAAARAASKKVDRTP